jgi:hypothetical protein
VVEESDDDLMGDGVNVAEGFLCVQHLVVGSDR